MTQRVAAGCRCERAARVLGERRSPSRGSSGTLADGGLPGTLREGPAGRQAELLGDDVEAAHELGYPVLDLQAGVHLEEPEPTPRIAQATVAALWRRPPTPTRTAIAWSSRCLGLG